MRLTVYVPKDSSFLIGHLKPGSAVVAGPPTNGTVTIYYEGNTLGAVNLVHYEDRLKSAADRLVNKYPTSACLRVSESELHAVGEYETDDWETIGLTDPVRLAAWLGNEPLPAVA